VADAASINAAPPGFVKGHVKIFSPKEVELADETPSKGTAENYSEYPLIVLSQDEKGEIARVTADEHGHYRVLTNDDFLDAFWLSFVSSRLSHFF